MEKYTYPHYPQIFNKHCVKKLSTGLWKSKFTHVYKEKCRNLLKSLLKVYFIWYYIVDKLFISCYFSCL